MKKKNFTLVELLCAVALVVILAGIGFSAYSYASYRGKEAATKSLINRIAAGLETLKTKHGFYPSSGSSYTNIQFSVNNTTGLIESIIIGSTTVDNAAQVKDFLAVADGESLKKYLVPTSGTTHNLTDAWGGRIQYRYPGAINTVKFDIIAPGADEAFGVAASPAPPVPATLADYKTAEEWACDDIANFK